MVGVLGYARAIEDAGLARLCCRSLACIGITDIVHGD